MARRIAFGFLTVLGLASLILAFTYEPVFRGIGENLVESQSPVKADAVLVLAGDFTGERVLRGGQLVAAHYAPIALVSGPFAMYGINEADLAIQFAVRNGLPAGYFEPVYVSALSTRDEAQGFAKEFRKRDIKKVLLVTSNFHTRRAAWTFRREVGDSVEVYSISAPFKFFQPESWWHNREGQKTVFYEYTRTLAARLGL